MDLQRPRMVAKLLVNLEQVRKKALIHNKSAGLVTCVKLIISLADLIADSQYNSRGKRTL